MYRNHAGKKIAGNISTGHFYFIIRLTGFQNTFSTAALRLLFFWDNLFAFTG
jgi:hypothetical protein